MDSAKADLVTVCARLGRLQLRLLAAYWGTVSGRGPKTIESFVPSSLWLDAVPRRTALNGVIEAVALAQAHLLVMADSLGPVDPHAACRALQHIQCSGSEWGAPTLRLAARLGYTLAGSPLAEFHGLDISERELRSSRHRPRQSPVIR
jgi:hypothetical protein